MCHICMFAHIHVICIYIYKLADLYNIDISFGMQSKEKLLNLYNNRKMNNFHKKDNIYY